MDYYRVHLATQKADFTPLPSYLVGFSPNDLADLTWIPASFENGYLVGYAWWREVNVSRPLGAYERYEANPTLTVNMEDRTVEALYNVVPWTDAEIAADKLQKYVAAGEAVNRVSDEYCNEVARKFGFFGPAPMLTGLSYIGSSLPEESARAAALMAWRDAVRVEAKALLDEVLLTGVVPDDAAIRQLMPAELTIPTPAPPDDDSSEDPPADTPVDPEPEPDEPETPPVDPEPLPTP
jgi:hypothetical protein